MLTVLGAKILSRIVERYLAINNVTVGEAIDALDENAEESDPMTIKVKQMPEMWYEQTLVELEHVLDTYCPKFSIYVLTLQS